MPDGSIAHFAEGSKLQDKEVFAGNGCKTPIHDVNLLTEAYPGSSSEKWQKVKAKSQIVLENGDIINAEINWYEEPSIGKVELKYKREI